MIRIRYCLLPLVGFALIFFLSAGLRAADVKPDLPKIPDRSFNVRDHGAKGDGTTNDTAALRATIEAAHRAGGGIVEVPAGNYLSGPLELFSQLNLHLAAGATLTMLPLDRYPAAPDAVRTSSAARISTMSRSPAPVRSTARANLGGRSPSRRTRDAPGCSS